MIFKVGDTVKSKLTQHISQIIEINFAQDYSIITNDSFYKENQIEKIEKTIDKR